MLQLPSYKAPSFICPHCSAFAQMRWNELNVGLDSTPFTQAVCLSCHRVSLWKAPENAELAALFGRKPQPPVMIEPRKVAGPPPHSDMPESCRADFEEAREIAARSPRGAAALLRLVVQKLCITLGQPGKSINDDIKALVQSGLPVDSQQALDVLRVTGNNAVHPGEMDLVGDPSLVAASFELINFIVDQQISQRNRIAKLFAALPEGAKDAIARRDGT